MSPLSRRTMQKALAMCMAALLLLAGCIGTDDADDAIEIVGCDDESSVTYVEDATTIDEELCAYEDVLESSIVDFIDMIENGPDMDSLSSTVGYTMEVSQPVGDEVWHYLETTVVSPDGYKLTIQDTYGDEHSSGEVIMSGNEIQYHLSNDTQDYTVRMKHAGTFADAFEAMMSPDDNDFDMDFDDSGSDADWEPYPAGYCEWEGNPEDESDVWSCKDDESDSEWDTWWYYCELHEGDWFCTDDYGQSSDYEDSADNDRYYSGGDETQGRQASQITGIDITQDDDMVVIAVTGDFTDDPETAPYFTLMVVKNGNSPEYALINIQEGDLAVWDYLEDGYGEVHVPTDILMSGFWDIEFSVWLYEESNQTAVSSQFTFFVPEDDGDDSDDDWWMDDSDDGEEMDIELDDDGNPETSFYTGLYNPMSATITDFNADESGYTFIGSLNYDGSPFSYLEIHTDSDFAVLGFTMEDSDDVDNWVEFMMIETGETDTDQTIPLSALPYILIDMSEMDDGGSDDYDEDTGDDVYWTPYYGGHCVWEGNDEDGEDDVWWCKYDESDSDWDTWWYYCELHDGDWFCTDNYGQSSDYEYSAGNDQYSSDDSEMSLDDFDVSSWDSTNDLQQIVDWFNMNYDYDENEDLMTVDDFLSNCDADASYVDYYVAECVFNSAMSMLAYDEDEEPVEEIHYYDNCTDDNGSYECWMDEWDYDNDGDFEESHGFDYADCTLQSNGSWMCITGYGDDYDDSEDVNEYYCVPFVNYTSEGFSIFDSTNLDSTTCGEPINDDLESFDFVPGETWTMPTHLIWEDCDDNGTDCETGVIMYDVSTTELWETTHENNYMDCDGTYDNNTSMCTEWIGNVTASDGQAFQITHPEQELLVFYQYDEVTQSGLVIFVSSDSDDEDFNATDAFEQLDMNGDGEITLTEWSDFTNSTDDPMSEDDIFNLSAMIDIFDDDNSGGLDLVEFTNFMENIDDMNEGDDMDPEMMFEMLDSNDDGEVSLTEWSDFTNSSDGPMSEDELFNLSVMFDIHDDDNSGGLDLDEFTSFMENANDMDGDDDMNPAMMFELFDTNDDGEVTSSEWSDFTNQTDNPMDESDFSFLDSVMNSYDDDESGGLDFDEFMNFMSSMEDMEDGEDNEPNMSVYLVIGLFEFAEGDLSDYSVELAMCEGDQILEIQCEESVYSVSLEYIAATDEEQAMIMSMSMPVIFVDSDGSGTLTSMDYVMINHDLLDVDGEWNMTRLHSEEADAYTDENPMMHLLPGFTGLFATIGLLGAALIRRE